MPRRSPLGFALLALILFAIPASADEAKKLPEALQKIRDAKASGDRYMGMTWHEVEARFLDQLEDARIARSMDRRAGGSDSTSATPVDSNPYVDQDTTVGKGNDSTSGSCLTGGADTAEDAWYRLVFTESVELTLWTTCESTGFNSYDTRLNLYDENLTLLHCNDDAPDCGQPYYQSRIEDVILAPGTYFVAVDGYNGAEGPYEFNASWTTAPVVCNGSDETNANVIDTFPYVSTDTTVDACDDILVDCELQVGTSGPDRWYRLDFDTDVLLDVKTTCDALDLDSRVAVLASDLTTLYCNDDDPLCPSHQSEIEDAYLGPGIYYVVVESPDGLGGPFTVEVDTTHAPPGLAQDLLPDIVTMENDLYDNVIVDNVVPGRTHLRLSNATANLGGGKLYLYGVNPGAPTPTHEVRQRIWRTDGTWYDRAAGQFVYHPGHNHIHIEDWSQYNLREWLPGNLVGNVIASGTKTSFCIIDLRVQDENLPNYVPGGEFHSCNSTIQGLSVGWADIYSKSLADQWIDITDVPDGTYWLESVADPGNNIAEKSDSNNIARIIVTIGSPSPINPDPFEPNPDPTSVAGRPVGQNNSPNLGPCGPQRTITALTLDQAGDTDWFMFYNPATGTSSDFVRIDFIHTQGDLEMALTETDGTVITTSETGQNQELISLDGVSAGWYCVMVWGLNDATSPSYDLTIDPATNGSPSVTVISPPAGDVQLIQSIDAYSVEWSSSDPETNEMWASVWVNSSPVFDGNEFFLETSLHTPAHLGLYILSTTYLDVGTYYVYVEVTDGGSTTGAWSEGTMTLVPQATPAPEAVGNTRFLAAMPNPFNPSTTLRLELAEHVDHLVWNIYDIRGARVRGIDAGHMHEGLHERTWDGRDDAGRAVSSGVYYARVRGGNVDLTQKLVLVK